MIDDDELVARRPMSAAQQANPGNRGMGRPRVPWRRTGREVLAAIEREGSTMAEQARLAGVSEGTLRRTLRDCGYVITRRPIDRSEFPEAKNNRVMHISALMNIEDRLRRELSPDITMVTVCEHLTIPIAHAYTLVSIVEGFRQRTPDNRNLMFEPLPGEPGNMESYDPDRGPTPYHRSANQTAATEEDRVGNAAATSSRSTRELRITDAEIIRLYRRAGWGLRAIARKAGCSPQTVSARLEDYGVPRRPRYTEPDNVTPVNIPGATS